MQTAVSAGREPGRTTDATAVFDVLGNEGCRTVLRAVGDETVTAEEVHERVDVPRSTIYRHLERLTAVGLLAESIRIDPRGRNRNQYNRTVGDLSVSLDADFAVSFR